MKRLGSVPANVRRNVQDTLQETYLAYSCLRRCSVGYSFLAELSVTNLATLRVTLLGTNEREFGLELLPNAGPTHKSVKTFNYVHSRHLFTPLVLP